MRDIYEAIRAERARQDEQWGGAAHDDEHDPSDWRGYRGKFETRAAAVLSVPVDQRRDALVKIAALAVAQIEAMDRSVQPGAPMSAPARTEDDFGRLLHERDVLLDVLRQVRLRVFDVYPRLDDATEGRVLNTLARYGDVTDLPTATPPRDDAGVADVSLSADVVLPFDVAEPSGPERAEWPEQTREYVEELERHLDIREETAERIVAEREALRQQLRAARQRIAAVEAITERVVKFSRKLDVGAVCDGFLLSEDEWQQITTPTPTPTDDA